MRTADKGGQEEVGGEENGGGEVIEKRGDIG